MFQNLRANNQLFILHKDENPLVDIGSVVSVSAAKPKHPMPTPIGRVYLYYNNLIISFIFVVCLLFARNLHGYF